MDDQELQPRLIFWCDIETTGLDPATDKILEIAYVLTDFRYPYSKTSSVAVAIGHHFVRGPGRDDLINNRCSAFIQDMHDKSGLTVAIGSSESYLETLFEIERRLLHLSDDWPGVEKKDRTPEEAFTMKEQRVVIGGNSAHFDLGFLRKHMPTFASRLSHRVFDASALSLVCRSMGMPRLPKSEAHRATLDVEASIEQARSCVRWMQP